MSPKIIWKTRPLSLKKNSKASLSVSYARPFKIPEVQGKELKFEKSFPLNKTVMVFTSRYDREKDMRLLYLKRFN